MSWLKNILFYSFLFCLALALEAIFFRTEDYTSILKALSPETTYLFPVFDWSLLKGGLGDESYIAIVQSIFSDSTFMLFKKNFVLALILFKERLLLFTQSSVFLLALLATLSDAFFSRMKASAEFDVFSPNRYSCAFHMFYWTAFFFAILLATPIKVAFTGSLWTFGMLLILLWTSIRHFHRFGR